MTKNFLFENVDVSKLHQILKSKKHSAVNKNKINQSIKNLQKEVVGERERINNYKNYGIFITDDELRQNQINFNFIAFGKTMDNSERLKYFNKCDLYSTTLIFFEAPSRILSTLEDLIPILGEKRKIVVCRELTKKFETIYRGTASQVKESLQSDILKGELVLLISPGIEELVGMNEIDMSLKKLISR